MLTTLRYIKLDSMLLTSSLGDYPYFSRLIRAHEESPRLVERKACWSETIIVPDVGFYLPAFADVWVAHDVDDCSLAG